MGKPDKIKVLWSCQRALTGAVTPNLRRMYVGWNNSQINLYFIFDGEISDEARDDASCVDCEIGADFIDDCFCEFVCLRVDRPQFIPSFGKVCVYARKEASSDFSEVREPFLTYLGEDYQKIEKDWVKRRLSVLLSCQRALLGTVTSNLRKVFVRWDEKNILLQFIFDGEISLSDENNVKLITERICHDFEGKSKVEIQCKQVDFPNQYKVNSEEEYCVYARKEIYPENLSQK